MKIYIVDAAAAFAELATPAVGMLLATFALSEYKNTPLPSILFTSVGLALTYSPFVAGPITAERMEELRSQISGRIKSRHLRSSISKEPYANLINDQQLTLGSRQLMLARYERMSKEGKDPRDISAHITQLHEKLSGLESLLNGTPTFGAEFFIESKMLAHYNPHFDMEKALSRANNLMHVAGNKHIRKSGINDYGTFEIRMNPSYAPITAALAQELFHMGVLPREVLVGYAINMVEGEDEVLPIALTHLYMGLTPVLSSQGSGYSFRRLHAYKGATVQPYTGTKREATTQMNLFTGVAGDISENPHISIDGRNILASDISARYRSTLLPFLVDRADCAAWAKSVYDVFGLDSKQVAYLQSKIANTNGDKNIWEIEKDVPLTTVEQRRAQIAQIYDRLEDTVASKRPELYFKLAELSSL